MVRRMVLLTGCAVSLILAAGCGSATTGAGSGPTSAAPQSNSSAAAPSSSRAAAATSAHEKSNATQAQSSKPAACKVTDLKVALGKGGVGGGSGYFPLQFTNTSDKTCTMRGFPKVFLVASSDGPEIGPPARPSDESSNLVTLKPGDAVHAQLQQASAGNYDPADCDPRPAGGLRVSPPDDTRAVFVAAESTGCAKKSLLQVSSVASGSGESR